MARLTSINPILILESLDKAELEDYLADGDPLEFSHTLEDQIGGQIAAGFALTGFYEDYWQETQVGTPLSKYMPEFIATKASKL